MAKSFWEGSVVSRMITVMKNDSDMSKEGPDENNNDDMEAPSGALFFQDSDAEEFTYPVNEKELSSVNPTASDSDLHKQEIRTL
jgi:hypothetical protein